MQGESLKGHLDLLVLATLKTGPLHGYAVIQSLRDRSGQQFDLPEGTVYPVLHRLERAGLLTSRWDAPIGRRRRVYQLTRSGRTAMKHQTAEWLAFARAVAVVVGVAP
jgi:PadR family transcriptional regulator, regulatory protein PadR